MTQDELKMGLEELAVRFSEGWHEGIKIDASDIMLLNEAAQALAQPEQEPLEYWNAVEGWVKIDEVRKHFDSVGCGTIYKSAGEGRVPLCLAQPEQEPVGQLLEDAFGRGQVMWFNKPKDESMLYTTPPQRKPLTDEEINQIADDFIVNYRIPAGSHYDFARAIEAAHGIKGEA